MRTTVDRDALLRELKAKAALEGTTLKHLVLALVEQGLRGGGDKYRRLASLPEIGFPAGPASCAAELERRLSANLPARQFTDACLAAFAESAKLRLVTFDKDFERFRGLDCLRLTAAKP